MILNKGEITKLGILSLRMGTIMQSSGASTGRIRITINRLINAYGYLSYMLITHRTITITILNDNSEPVFNSVMRTKPVGVNFKIISGISRMSLTIEQHPWKLEDIEKEIDRLTEITPYSKILRLTFVSLAGAGFCFISGGYLPEMAVAALATFIGLFARLEINRLGFNNYLSVFVAAFIATSIASFFGKIIPEISMIHASATSVLFLIPGVPLINSLNDIIEGNILNGVIRAVDGFVISFMIALGILGSVLFYSL